jgi:hypothetical protein
MGALPEAKVPIEPDPKPPATLEGEPEPEPEPPVPPENPDAGFIGIPEHVEGGYIQGRPR